MDPASASTRSLRVPELLLPVDLAVAPAGQTDEHGYKGQSTQMQSALGEAPDRHRLLVSAHGKGPKRQSLADGVSRRLTHGVGDDELRTNLFVEALEARRQIHRRDPLKLRQE